MDLATTISRACLRGRPCPPSLAALCAGYPGSLRTTLIERLLTSPDEVEEWFGGTLETETPDGAANTRAHFRMFERLGFFAEGEDALWAFDLASGLDEPPVAALDTEGQYEWIGIDLAEVLRLRGDLVLSTQFLPKLADIFADYYALEMGTPRPKRFPSPFLLSVATRSHGCCGPALKSRASSPACFRPRTPSSVVAARVW